MVDISALMQPRDEDREALEEFAEDLNDLAPRIEQDIARLKQAPGDHALIGNLFRSVHTIKGDAGICRVAVAVAIAHPIEALLARLREGEMPFSALLAEVFLLALDRLELATESLMAKKSLTHLKLADLVTGLETMADAPAGALDEAAVRLVESVTGYRPALAEMALRGKAPSARNAKQQSEDLAFFRSLAHQFESRSPLYKGRSGRLLRLTLDTNTVAGKPVDPVQLEAAVYLHDLGMMFLPESVWLKLGRLSDEDKAALRLHPDFGAGLLARIDGWQPAAEMVAQHHEMPDGGGYPRGLKAEAICPGAKILAIADAFEAVTLKHNHRGHNRSLLRAIAEINACDKQFSPEWIGHFNTVVRRIAEAKA